MIIGDDFNCILTNSDCNGTINFSEVLDKVAHGFGVDDVWGNCISQSRVYTLHLEWSDAPWSNICHIKPKWSEVGSGNRGCGIYIT
jgi:hypothetical protein